VAADEQTPNFRMGVQINQLTQAQVLQLLQAARTVATAAGLPLAGQHPAEKQAERHERGPQPFPAQKGRHGSFPEGGGVAGSVHPGADNFLVNLRRMRRRSMNPIPAGLLAAMPPGP
jgi:hypothetical protein